MIRTFKISKITLWLIAVVIGAGIIICVAINLWLQSSRVQAQLRKATQDALGIPVQIGRTYYLPWFGIILGGIRTESTLPHTPEFQAKHLRLRFQILPLLRREFHIQEIILDEPSLLWTQSENEPWQGFEKAFRVPGNRLVEQLTPSVPSSPDESHPSSPSPLQTHTPQTEFPKHVDSQSPVGFQVNLDHIRMRKGHAKILHTDGHVLFSIDGMEIDAHITNNASVEGSTSVQKITFGESLTFENFRSPFKIENEILTMDGLKVRLAEGKVDGFLEVRVTRPDLPFKSHLALHDINLAALLSQIHLPNEDVEGAFNGKADLRGTFTRIDDLEGAGLIELNEGRISPPEILRSVGALLKIDELQDFGLRNAAMRFTVQNQNFFVEDLTLKSENLIMKLDGKVRFNGKLKLDGRFLINEEIQNRLSKMRIQPSTFSPAEDIPGHKQVMFEVTGWIDSPRTNLLEKIVGHHFGGNLGGSIGGFIRSFFQPQSLPVQKSSPPPSSSPTASPSPSF